jgi:hypothetical protein
LGLPIRRVSDSNHGERLGSGLEKACASGGKAPKAKALGLVEYWSEYLVVRIVNNTVCEEKVTHDNCPVHSSFTPAGIIMMADSVWLTFGDHLAPARR